MPTHVTSPALLTVAILVTLASPTVVSAKCPVPLRACEALQKADIVFYAEVVSATGRRGDQQVTFQVLRSFKGVPEGRFAGAFVGGRDSLFFVAGQRQVVYAMAAGKRRWSTVCSRSATVIRPASSEIADLETCRMGSPRR